MNDLEVEVSGGRVLFAEDGGVIIPVDPRSFIRIQRKFPHYFEQTGPEACPTLHHNAATICVVLKSEVSNAS
jgi:hypothetical protein